MKKVLDFCNITGESVKEYEGERNYIATGDVVDNKIISFEKVTYKNKPSRANQNAKVGDVLFAKMKDTQKVVIIDENNVRNIYSTGFFVITPEKDVRSEYLYWLFNSNKFNEQKNKNCKGATQKALNNEGFSKILIKEIPSIREQEKIVDKLNKVQELIDIRKKQIEELETLIKAQFVELFGNPFSNEKNWIKDDMGKYLSALTDFSANGSYAVLDSQVKMYDTPNYAYMVRTTDLENNNFTKDVKYIDENAYNLLSKSKVYGNEIIMCKIGSAGKCYLMPNLNKPVSLGRNAFLFRYNSYINPVFIYNLLTSEYGQNEISKFVRGAVTKTITKDDARKIQIIIPPIELQNQFAEFVKLIDKQKFELQKNLEEMEKLQDSLMNKYFG